MLTQPGADHAVVCPPTLSAEIQVGGNYYNANFINIKVDIMEKEEGPQIASTYGVGSYPTLLYIDGGWQKVV